MTPPQKKCNESLTLTLYRSVRHCRQELDVSGPLHPFVVEADQRKQGDWAGSSSRRIHPMPYLDKAVIT